MRVQLYLEVIAHQTAHAACRLLRQMVFVVTRQISQGQQRMQGPSSMR